MLRQLEPRLPEGVFGRRVPHVCNKLREADALAADELILPARLAVECKLRGHLNATVSRKPSGSPLPKHLRPPNTVAEITDIIPASGRGSWDTAPDLALHVAPGTALNVLFNSQQPCEAGTVIPTGHSLETKAQRHLVTHVREHSGARIRTQPPDYRPGHHLAPQKQGATR